MPEPIKIDVWSDVVCPWCYIGKRRLEAGVGAFVEHVEQGPPVEIEFHSFELNPDLPVDYEGNSVDFLTEHKRIPASQVRQLQDHVAGIAAGEGLEYDFSSLQPTNTAKAHQLLHFAKSRGLQAETKERLMRAHFVEGRHVGRDEELAELAGEVGLDEDEVLASLKNEEFLPAVRLDEQLASEIGIRGVPFFVVGRRYAVSGAQPSGIFTQALNRVLAEPAGEDLP